MVKVVDIPSDQLRRHVNCKDVLDKWAKRADDLEVEMIAVTVIVVTRDGMSYSESVSDGYVATLLGAIDIAHNAILQGD